MSNSSRDRETVVMTTPITVWKGIDTSEKATPAEGATAPYAHASIPPEPLS